TSAAQTNNDSNDTSGTNNTSGTNKPLFIGVNQYTTMTMYKRDSQNFIEHLDEIKKSGADGIEGMANSAENVVTYAKQLKDHGLALRSLYMGGNFIDPSAVDATIAHILAIASAAKEYGTEVIVCNPDAKSGKSDEELILQAKSLDQLGAKLRDIGLTLALHYHTTELEFGGREFHHTLLNTNPENLSLCIEQHWSYRACGNSQVALFDHIKLYGDRIAEIHLRQSRDHVWTETYGDGDIDNSRFVSLLQYPNRSPMIVLEQAPEAKTPKTLTAAEALRASIDYTRAMFKG
ncbi:MAG: sugar phosphate isomerase/epimerase family protein, partial [Thermoguttaceae bacterium]